MQEGNAGKVNSTTVPMPQSAVRESLEVACSSDFCQFYEENDAKFTLKAIHVASVDKSARMVMCRPGATENTARFESSIDDPVRDVPRVTTGRLPTREDLGFRLDPFVAPPC
jgi:hypothetical protein